MNIVKTIVLLFTLILLFACGSLPDPQADNHASKVKTQLTAKDRRPNKNIYKKLTKNQIIYNELNNIMHEFGEHRNFSTPASLYQEVKVWISAFTSPSQSRQWFKNALNRMNRIYPKIATIFPKGKLPPTLYSIALVESGFKSDARSPAGAIGLWQFMPATAKQYGLVVNRKIDQRRNIKLSTIAARDYLNDLIMDFGNGHSTLLAIAAYNAGENRIRKQLRKLDNYRERNFWSLADEKLLPKETANYVPKILAAAIILRHREMFGFSEQYASLY